MPCQRGPLLPDLPPCPHLSVLIHLCNHPRVSCFTGSLCGTPLTLCSRVVVSHAPVQRGGSGELLQRVPPLESLAAVQAGSPGMAVRATRRPACICVRLGGDESHLLLLLPWLILYSPPSCNLGLSSLVVQHTNAFLISILWRILAKMFITTIPLSTLKGMVKRILAPRWLLGNSAEWRFGRWPRSLSFSS